jgi:hypothetical protein
MNLTKRHVETAKTYQQFSKIVRKSIQSLRVCFALGGIAKIRNRIVISMN